MEEAPTMQSQQTASTADPPAAGGGYDQTRWQGTWQYPWYGSSYGWYGYSYDGPWGAWSGSWDSWYGEANQQQENQQANSEENHRESTTSSWYSNSGDGWGTRSGSRGSDPSLGKWWNTPQGRLWGNSLDEAIEHALSRGWIHLDKAFCTWWTGGSTSEADNSRESSQEQSVQGSTHGQSANDSEEGESKKDRSGKDSIPEYDGTSTIREYRRRVKLFESVTSISPQYRGGRLLERLSGLAWRAAETLNIDDLKNENGVAILLDHLESELEPLEYMKTFQVLSHFYNSFRRQRGEQMTSFDTSFRIQCEKLREVGSPLEGTARAWWFLQKAGISDEVRQKVVSAANGQYEYTRLRQALVAIIPDVNKHNFDGASTQQGQPSQSGGHRKWQSHKKVTVSHRVNAVEGEAEGDHDEDTISEAGEMEREAEILMTQAAKKRNEVEKARGFSQGNKETPEDRQKRITALKQRLPCSACKAAGVVAFGHWHSDPECPQQGKASGTFVVENAHGEEESEENDLEEAFQVGVTEHAAIVLFTSEGMRKESQHLALSDTCCARSVAGQRWVANHVARMMRCGIPFCCMREREPFRFGAGPRVYSSWALVFPLEITGVKHSVWIRCSVVEENVPFLLSRAALRSLGAVLDLDASTVCMKKLGNVTIYPFIPQRWG